MQFRNFNLKALFLMTTVCAVGIIALPHFGSTSNSWCSGWHDSEIQSAIVHYSILEDDVSSTYTLTKKDTIRFVRLAESCPTKDFFQSPTSSIPRQNGQGMCSVELKLSRNRSFEIPLVANFLVVRGEFLIDIGSKDEKIKSLLWPRK